MKKILIAICGLAAVSSCSMSERFGLYSYDPEAYMRISDRVVSECLHEAVATMEYVRFLYTKDDIQPEDGASFVITDESGAKVGPFVCHVSGTDTIWRYASLPYEVRRISKDKGEWQVDRHDDIDKNPYSFNYDFVLTIEEGEKAEEEKYAPLTVSLDGKRFESGDYHLTYRTDGPFVMRRTSDAAYNCFSMSGVIDYAFFEGAKRRDWLTARFSETGTISYETSF